MACLSWRREGSNSFTVAANPIYILSDLTAPMPNGIEFEILAKDAELLLAHVGAVQSFYIDDQSGVFSAKLSPLVPVTSTHSGLALLRAEPTLRGRFDIVDT